MRSLCMLHLYIHGNPVHTSCIILKGTFTECLNTKINLLKINFFECIILLYFDVKCKVAENAQNIFRRDSILTNESTN